jgi:iron complex outermembrane recepter protein
MKNCTTTPTHWAFSCLRFIFITGALICAGSLSAQEDEAKANSEDKEVVKLSPFRISDDAYVGYGASETSSGSRIVMKLTELPQTINVITRDLMDDMGSADPSEAMLKIAPGVTPFGNAGGVNIQIRGFRAQNWSIDGATTRYRSIINNYLFDSIEVIKGPSTLLFGPFGSYGGYVNANAKYANKNMKNKLEASVGTESFYSGMVDVGGALTSNGKALYRLTTAYHSQDQAGTDYDYSGYFVLAPSFAYQFSPDTQIKVRFEYIDSDERIGDSAYDINGNILESFTSSGPLELTKHKAKSYGVQAIFEARLSDEWHMRVNVAGQHLLDSPLVTGALTGNSLAQTYNFQATPIDTTQSGAYADLSLAWKKESFGPNGSMSNDLIFGGDINYWNLENVIYDTVRYPASKVAPLDPSNPDWTGYDFDTPYPTRFTPYNVEWLGGGFIQETLGLFNRKLLLSFGVKWNYDARTNQVQQLNVVSPSGVMVGDPTPYAVEKTPTYRYGVVYKPIDNLSLYAGHTESYRSGAGANRKVDGSQLDPQEGVNDEVGAKIDFPGVMGGVLSGSVAFFQTEVTNIWRGDPNNPTFFVQDGVQENSGFETQITYGGEKLSFVVGYYKGDGPIVTSDPTLPRAAYAPDETFNLWTKYRVTKALEIGGGLRYQSDTVSSRNDGMMTDPFTVGDMFATYSMPYRDGVLKYRLGVSNLTDNRAPFRINRPSSVAIVEGRRVKLTASYTW